MVRYSLFMFKMRLAVSFLLLASIALGPTTQQKIYKKDRDFPKTGCKCVPKVKFPNGKTTKEGRLKAGPSDLGEAEAEAELEEKKEEEELQKEAAGAHRKLTKKGISKAKAKSGKGASPPPDRNAATAPTPREEEEGTELDPSVFTCEREEMPNIHCNIWSGDEGREDCPKGYECCRGKCVPGPGCGCCGGCLFGGCENLGDPESICYNAGTLLPTTPGYTISYRKPLMFVGMSPSRPCEEALDCPEPYKCLAGSCGRLAELETCKGGKGCKDGSPCREGVCRPSKSALAAERVMEEERDIENGMFNTPLVVRGAAADEF